MIKNERQYRMAIARVKDFDAALVRVKAEAANMPDVAGQMYLETFLGGIAELRSEIAEYEAIRDGSDKIIGELPLVLIKARIRRHLTQADLAQRLGVHEQQVQRWEEHDYQGVAFERLCEIARVLQVKVRDAVLA